MRRLPFLRTLVSAALVVSAVPAFASVVNTYTSRTTWLADSSGVQNVDFAGLAPVNGVSSIFYSLNIDSVAFTAVQGAGSFGMQAVDTNMAPWYNFGGGNALMMPNLITLPVPYFHIVLPSAVTSFGVDLMSVSPGGVGYTVTADGTSFTVPTFTAPTPGFFGATFDSPVTTIDITPLGISPGDYTNALMDNFSFGTAAGAVTPPTDETPEAATLVMIGVGLVGLRTIRKRQEAI